MAWSFARWLGKYFGLSGIIWLGLAPFGIAVDLDSPEATQGSMVLHLSAPNKKMRLLPPRNSQVEFDLDGDGRKERTGWIGSANVGLLALDLNRNGRIDDGKELVSSATPSGKKQGPNAYEVLGMYDSNKDGIIDRSDTIYYSLRIWIDKNRNGKTDSRELFTLAQKGIESIAISYTATGNSRRRGNSIGYESRFFGPKQCGDSGCRSMDVSFGKLDEDQEIKGR